MYKTSLSISEVIRLSVRCWTRKPAAIVLIALAALVPHSLFGMFLQLDPAQSPDASISDTTLILWEFMEVAAWSAVEVALVLAILQALNNRAVDLRASVNFGARFLLLAVGIDAVVYLPWVLIYILWDAQSLTLFALVTGLWICTAVVASVAVPALVVERRGIWGSLRRSYDLTRGSRLRIFAIFLGVELAARALRVILETMIAYLPVETLLRSGSAILEILHLVDHAFFAMVSAIVSVVLYQALRVLKGEGDSEKIAAVFE